MGAADFIDFGNVSMPHRRNELILFLEELETPDPRPLWREQRERGLVPGIDQMFHFFFDDNDFDDSAIGVTLRDRSEVAAIQNVKARLDAMLERVGDQGDDAFVEHPLWPQVTTAASNALRQIATPP